ncbi:hypothetical protein MMC31_003099 [Peltigera leucophlebia]|nr:hypothetical protein [Peltigera leucophlebia]
MSIGSAILLLETLARKAEYTAEAFGSLNSKAVLTKEHYHALESASTRIWEVIAKIADKIDILKEDRVKWVEKEGETLAAQAVSAREKLLAHGKPPSPATFRRNITLFFDGPKDSPIDPSSAKSKNKLARIRCAQIRCLSHHGIISWAAAFPPTVWTGMPEHAFDYLIENVEPKELQAWPEKIGEILHAFAEEEPLGRSDSYRAFLTAFDNCSVPKKDSAISQKRKHIDDEKETVTIKKRREIQYMFSKAPVSKIPLLGSLLSDAVKTSHNWKMERSLGEPTTECLTTMIPRDPTQDISMTLWVGPETGGQIIDVFELRPT